MTECKHEKKDIKIHFGPLQITPVMTEQVICKCGKTWIQEVVEPLIALRCPKCGKADEYSTDIVYRDNARIHIRQTCGPFGSMEYGTFKAGCGTRWTEIYELVQVKDIEERKDEPIEDEDCGDL